MVSNTPRPISGGASGLPTGTDELLRDVPDRLLDLLPVAVYVCDRHGAIVRYNRAAAELWGRVPEAGDRFCGSFRLYDRDSHILPHERCPMASVLQGGAPVRDAEVGIGRPDGERRIVLVNIDPIVDAAGAIVGAVNCFRDITERRRMQERQDLLLREMDHRIKNLFTLASGVVSLSARGAATPEETADMACRRLEALARAHSLTLPARGFRHGEGERSTTVAALIETVVSPYVDTGDNGRVVLDGPRILVGGSAVTSLALLLHEFATNAAKYGALSSPAGRILVSWHVDADMLHLTWREEGGPALSGAESAGEGFGSLLARGTVTGQLGGSLSRDWRPDGLVVTLTARLDRLG